MAEIVNKLNDYEDRIKTLENKEIETISPESVNEYEDRIKALENKEVEKSNTIKTYASAAVNKYFKDNPVQKQKEVMDSLKKVVKDDLDAGNWPELKEASDIELKNRFQALLDEKLDERDKDKKDEILEEERRKNNLVVYGVNEVKENDKDKRTKHDKEEIIRISNFLGLDDFSEYNILRILRMGTYIEGTARPILVELDSAVTKYKIMRNTFKLKDVKEFEGWSLQHDMTKDQRENVKKLIKEAEEKEKNDTSGEYIYRVRGPPHNKYIKKIKKTK